jgi:hypothetical protein
MSTLLFQTMDWFRIETDNSGLRYIIMKRKILTGIIVFYAVLVFSSYGFTAPVPDTGQTTCYDVPGNVITCPSSGQPFYGQDANYTPSTRCLTPSWAAESVWPKPYTPFRRLPGRKKMLIPVEQSGSWRQYTTQSKERIKVT